MNEPLDEHPMNPINQEGYDDWTHPDDEKMSEQPQEKPLERCSSNPYYEAHFGDSEQPQEWTPEYVENELLFEGCLFEGCFKKIADAHNAALAAAQWQIEMDTECIERIRNHGMKMELQLAAEREKLNAIKELLDRYSDESRPAVAVLSDIEAIVFTDALAKAKEAK